MALTILVTEGTKAFFHVPPVEFGQHVAVLVSICIVLPLLRLLVTNPSHFDHIFRPRKLWRVLGRFGVGCGLLTFAMSIISLLGPGMSSGRTPHISAWFGYALLFGGYASFLLLSPPGHDKAHPRFRAILAMFAALPPLYVLGAACKVVTAIM